MSIHQVTELFEGRSGSSAGVSAMEQTRILRIQTNNPDDDFFTIIGQYPGPGPVSMPALYDPLDSNELLTLRKVDGKQHKGQMEWRFEYFYSSAPIPREIMDRELFPNPLDRPARASGVAHRYTTIPKSWRFIAAGVVAPEGAETGITTSAGVPFDSLKEIDDSRWVFHFEKNYPADEFPEWLTTWDPDSVNSTTCFILGFQVWPRTLKLTEPKFSDVKRENDVDYRTISFDIDYDAATWDYAVPDRGFSVIVSGVLKKIVMGDGTTPATPQLLNGTGGLLAGSTYIAQAVSDSTDVVFRSGVVYPDEDFNLLPINESSTPPFSPQGEE